MSRATILRSVLLGSAAFYGTALSKILFVGGSTGAITTLNFTGTEFTTLSSTLESSPNPSWQTLDGDILYSTSENLNGGPGKITAYNVGADGKLAKISSAESIGGPVSIAIKGDLLVSASYLGSGVNSFSNSKGTLKPLKSFHYTMPSPGPNPTRQDAPHPHQAIIDPTGKFVIVPDLAADLLRTFRISDDTTLTEITATTVKPGYGPRHGVFIGDHFYLICELANVVIVYQVEYTSVGAGTETIGFRALQTVSTYGPDLPTPVRTPAVTAGEIAVSPDKKFLYLTNRGDKNFMNGTSDSLVYYKVASDGLVKFYGASQTGGFAPRHFSLDKKGELVVVANQDSGNVAVFKRDLESGLVARRPVAVAKVEGAECVTWFE